MQIKGNTNTGNIFKIYVQIENYIKYKYKYKYRWLRDVKEGESSTTQSEADTHQAPLTPPPHLLDNSILH